MYKGVSASARRAGIVAIPIPSSYNFETLHKARALLEALVFSSPPLTFSPEAVSTKNFGLKIVLLHRFLRLPFIASSLLAQKLRAAALPITHVRLFCKLLLSSSSLMFH